MNRDGYLDFIFGGMNFPELLIFHGNAEGFDVDNPQHIYLEIDGVVYDNTGRLYLANLNNDGWLDLVVLQYINKKYYFSDRSFILWGGPVGPVPAGPGSGWRRQHAPRYRNLCQLRCVKIEPCHALGLWDPLAISERVRCLQIAQLVLTNLVWKEGSLP